MLEFQNATIILGIKRRIEGIEELEKLWQISTHTKTNSAKGRRILETALDESKRRDQNFVSIEHILHAIALEEGDLSTRRCAIWRSIRDRCVC
ncbi:MAG: hypothetical protein IPJ30_28050 [Acidobacteria bacterium]|nr:hypothetical protein [Acidobacteriota bacterium]